MNEEQIKQMQATLSGMKTQAEGIKASLAETTNKPPTTSQTILDTLTQKILSSSGAVSSADTGIDKMLKEAYSSAKGIQEAGASRIGLEAEEQAETIKETGTQTLTSAREAQRGFGTNTAALKAIQDSTTKQLNDLDKRKDQALLENNTALVDKISNLQLKAIEFQQQAEQQTFSNILAVGGFELQQQTQERLNQQFLSNLEYQKQTQSFKEKQTIAGIAAEYGLTMDENETLESIVNKVKPMASAIKKAELQKLLETTTKTKTQFNLDSTLTQSLIDGQSPEQAAMNAINVLTSTTGIEADAEQLEGLRQRAIEIQTDLNAKKAEVETTQLTSGTSFMTSVMNTITGSSQSVRSLRTSIRNQKKTIETLDKYGASKEAIDIATKKLSTLENNLYQAISEEESKSDSGSFFSDLFGG